MLDFVIPRVLLVHIPCCYCFSHLLTRVERVVASSAPQADKHSSEETYGEPFQASQDYSVVYDSEGRDGFDEFTHSFRDAYTSEADTSSDDDSDCSEDFY
jgi:hypothetical protein